MANLFVVSFLNTIEKERWALEVTGDRGMHDILRQSAHFRPSQLLGDVLNHPDEWFRRMCEEVLWDVSETCQRYLGETKMDAHFKVTEALAFLVLLSQIGATQTSGDRITNIGLKNISPHDQHRPRRIQMREAAIFWIMKTMRESCDGQGELMQRIIARSRKV